MIALDVNTFIGGYPFRYIPHPEPDILAGVLRREGIAAAWTGHLPSAWYRDPAHGNETLFEALRSFAGVLHPVPTIRPDWPAWERAFADVVARGVPAVRAYPCQWRMAADDRSMQRLAAACGEAGVALVLTTRFEDLRQRHWMDAASDLGGASIRALARVDGRAQLVVTAAGRALIEEVHWGLTPEERSRVSWDLSWIWGPPEDDLSHLVRTMGAERFAFGTQWPLRLVQAPQANLDLLPADLRANVLRAPMFT